MKKLKKETWYENIYARIAPILTMNRNSKDSPDSRIIESDAVSSVVALMLLLAVVATFISLYSTSYIPGLKEQSEITQIATVKESFIKFSGDVEHIVMEKTPASCGNMIPLGGRVIFCLALKNQVEHSPSQTVAPWLKSTQDLEIALQFPVW
ncbi:hypothetical protein [Methanogenium cariaci]|uniref:hypothetical protein n=1 Tax=Methanogenium cariaci TaxID=2197 RepID=UPI0007827951|nr:hypothetical protein [Methanogenium cariaci]